MFVLLFFLQQCYPPKLYGTGSSLSQGAWPASEAGIGSKKFPELAVAVLSVNQGVFTNSHEVGFGMRFGFTTKRPRS